MTAPIPDKYALRPIILQFRDSAVESAYREETLAHTLWFCRGAWALIPLLGGGFGLLDQRIYGENAPLVLTVRAVLVAVALLVGAATFWRRLRPWLTTSSALYILLVGSFCTFLVRPAPRNCIPSSSTKTIPGKQTQTPTSSSRGVAGVA